MTTGIDCVGLEKASDDSKEFYSYMVNDLESLKNEFELIESCYEGIDIKFLCEHYKEELEQLDNVNLKASAYQDTLLEVINGYKNQESNIASSVSLYL